ncbi:hypothetical protein P171DRAFT_59572 [Karstenula rhodostoma CBS 690.94]|uniref:HTH araC/xylS-type domain-containing protein n=1 Tax=Karstenula rhodostoma CBS 690.94 TaxID=1392251 RepID=A0A9P4PDI6_9PLEO|nr:hypothetical protein P171DRAFT_59572 [Karstenula rhodostoma CBS 690.94]
MAYTTDASRWRALTTRDPAAATAFVYTVKSTRIYCRPTCPARLARRANVAFCATPAAAAALGFRPCKRCKPDKAPAQDPQEAAVARACVLIGEAVERGEEGVRLRVLAREVGLTERYFHKVFKERMGVTPRGWARGMMAGGKGGEMGTPGLVGDSPLGVEGFELDAFDFNELVDFEGDAGVAGDGMAVDLAMAPLGAFGDPFDARASMCGWDTFAPDYLGSGFRLDDKVSRWAGGALIPDAAMTKASGTFE